MAEIDPSIALNVKPFQLQDPVEGMARAYQLSNLGLQNQQAQKAADDQQTIAQVYRNATNADGSVDKSKLYTGLAQQGQGQHLQALQQQDIENGLKRAQTGEAQGKADSSQFDLAAKKNDLFLGVGNSLLQNNTTDRNSVISGIVQLQRQGALNDNDAAQLARNITDDPNQNRALLTQAMQQHMGLAQQLQTQKEQLGIQQQKQTIQAGAAPVYKDTGGALTGIDPLTGKPTGATIAKTSTPGEILTDARDQEKIKLQADKGFTPDEGELLGSLAQHGVQLPAGLRSKEQMKATVRNLIDRNPGKSMDDIAQMVGNGQINFSSDKASANVAAKQEGKVATAVNELGTFGDQALEASAKVPRGNFVPFNKLTQMADSSISDPNLLTLKLKLNALNNAYNVLSARGGTDAASRAHIQQLFSSANSFEGVQALVTALKQEGVGAKSSAAAAAHVGGSTGVAPTGAKPSLDSIFGTQ